MFTGKLKAWNRMKKDLHLVASVDRPEMLHEIIVKLAIRPNDVGHGKARIARSWYALDTSSIEAYISGGVEFDYNETQRINIPYITGFVFSCTKEHDRSYDLKWSFSLS
jgi:hypothetical protein